MKLNGKWVILGLMQIICFNLLWIVPKQNTKFVIVGLQSRLRSLYRNGWPGDR